MKTNRRSIYALSSLMMLFVVATVFFACNKKDEVATAGVENNGKKPLAVTDLSTGKTTYNFDVEKITTKLNEQLSSKDQQDRYIIESIEVLDEDPTNISIRAEMKYVVLDTESEETHTIWLMESFLEKERANSITNYYLNEQISNGDYLVGLHADNKTYVIEFSNGLFSNTVEYDGIVYLPWVPRWTISCTATNCTGGCFKEKVDDHVWDCSACPVIVEGTKCVRGMSWLLQFLKSEIISFN